MDCPYPQRHLHWVRIDVHFPSISQLSRRCIPYVCRLGYCWEYVSSISRRSRVPAVRDADVQWNGDSVGLYAARLRGHRACTDPVCLLLLWRQDSSQECIRPTFPPQGMAAAEETPDEEIGDSPLEKEGSNAAAQAAAPRRADDAVGKETV